MKDTPPNTYFPGQQHLRLTTSATFKSATMAKAIEEWSDRLDDSKWEMSFNMLAKVTRICITATTVRWSIHLPSSRYKTTFLCMTQMYVVSLLKYDWNRNCTWATWKWSDVFGYQRLDLPIQNQEHQKLTYNLSLFSMLHVYCVHQSTGFTDFGVELPIYSPWKASLFFPDRIIHFCFFVPPSQPL